LYAQATAQLGLGLKTEARQTIDKGMEAVPQSDVAGRQALAKLATRTQVSGDAA
jgi:hypothetical protein